MHHRVHSRDHFEGSLRLMEEPSIPGFPSWFTSTPLKGQRDAGDDGPSPAISMIDDGLSTCGDVDIESSLLKNDKGVGGHVARPHLPHGPQLASDDISASGMLNAPRRYQRAWLSKALSTAWEQHYRSVTYDDIPDWMKDNSLILSQYRPQLTVQQAAWSLFSWHNETINVWTHLMGWSDHNRILRPCDKES